MGILEIDIQNIKKPRPMQYTEVFRTIKSRERIRRTSINEPSREKTNNVVSEQVRHKPACTSTENS